MGAGCHGACLLGPAQKTGIRRLPIRFCSTYLTELIVLCPFVSGQNRSRKIVRELINSVGQLQPKTNS